MKRVGALVRNLWRCQGRSDQDATSEVRARIRVGQNVIGVRFRVRHAADRIERDAVERIALRQIGEGSAVRGRVGRAD